MPKLYLHVGTHKTGTTSIQSLASNSRAFLAEEGLIYPDSVEWFGADPRLQSANAHFIFANALAKMAPRDERRLGRFRAHIDDEIVAGRNVLISAESLYRHVVTDPNLPMMKGSKSEMRDAWRASRERFIKRLAAFLKGLPVEVVLYLRRPDNFMESMFSESHVSTGNRQGFERFLTKYGIRFEYPWEIELFSRYWQVKLFNFEEEKYGLPIGFFSKLDLPIPTEVKQNAARVSVPKAAVLWLRRAKNTCDVDDRERKNRWVFALQASTRDLFRADEKSTFWADEAQRDAFLDETGLHFGDIVFEAPNGLPPTCVWSGTEHKTAELCFADWSKRNADWLAARAENRVPPFIDPQSPY